MLAFYNKHIPSAARYSNYWAMVCRLMKLAFSRYFSFWKDLRVIPVIALVPMGIAGWNGVKAFIGEEEEAAAKEEEAAGK